MSEKEKIVQNRFAFSGDFNSNIYTLYEHMSMKDGFSTSRFNI